MAQFCARVRKRDDLPRGLDQGRLPAPHHPGPGTRRSSAPRRPAAVDGPVAAPGDGEAGHHNAVRHLCGVLQVLTFLAYAYVTALVAVAGL